MADIELVIKMDEDIAQGIIDGKNDKPMNIVRAFQATIADAIKNGTPLPKGHGRLIDADAIIFREIDEIGGEYNPYLGCSQEQIDAAPTIIEADKGDKE